MVHLLTIQPHCATELLAAGKPFRCDARLSAKDGYADIFVEQYDWLAGEMVRNGIQRPAGWNGRWPVWAWVKHSPLTLRDTRIREVRRTASGREYTTYPLDDVLALDVPEERLFMTDFNRWSYIIIHAQGNLMPTVEDWNTKQDDPSTIDEWIRRSEEATIEEKRASWHNVCTTSEEWEYAQTHQNLSDWIQATLWEIRPEDVCMTLSGNHSLKAVRTWLN